MGISAQADKKPLLVDEEQNIGNSAEIQPEPGPPNGTATVIPQTSPIRVVKLAAGSAAGQTTSIVVTAARLPSNKNPNPGVPGPLTGIIEFGNGGRSTRMEFDMPIGPYVGQFLGVAEASEPRDGVTIVTVPTGIVRLLVRYDNLLIAPLLANSAATAGGQVMLADVQGVPRLGPGGPVTYAGAIGAVPAEPLLAQAMAAYFNRHYTKTYKTLYCYVGHPLPGPLPIPALISSSPAPAITTAYYALPAFTRSFRVLRLPTSAMTITLVANTLAVEQFAVGAGAACPDIPVIGHENVVGIQSTGPAETVRLLMIVCEVGI